MSLVAWLLCDAVYKGGPGSGPHVLGAGAYAALQRLAQDDTHEGRLAAEKLREYDQRQGGVASKPSASSIPSSFAGASDELMDARRSSALAQQNSRNMGRSTKSSHQQAAQFHRNARDAYRKVSSKESPTAVKMVQYHNDKAMEHDREARKY